MSDGHQAGVTGGATGPFAVVGATGKQGAAVVDALLGAGSSVRALVRDPSSPAALDLAARGVVVVEADQEDRRSLVAGLAGAAGLFFHTTFVGPAGGSGEVRRGAKVVDAAVEADIPCTVYSSVGGAERSTGVSFFESKDTVERYLLARLPAKVVRPVFFMENLLPQLVAQSSGDVVLRYPMPGDVPVQMIAVGDVGRVAARLLHEPGALAGDAIEIAGDQRTLGDVALELAAFLGRPTRYEPLPLDVVEGDLRSMFAWFSSADAYRADFAGTRALVPDALDLRRWLELQSYDAVDQDT